MESEDPATRGATTIDSFLRAAAAIDDRPVPPQLDEPLADDARYGEVTELARGGMGRIVAAHDRRLDRTGGRSRSCARSERRDRGAGSRREIAADQRGSSHPAIVPRARGRAAPVDGTPWSTRCGWCRR
jgi:hypothetical protein